MPYENRIILKMVQESVQKRLLHQKAMLSNSCRGVRQFVAATGVSGDRAVEAVVRISDFAHAKSHFRKW
jgi:hypothetical protein